MPAIITNKFRIHNAKSFIEGFSELDGIEGSLDPCISSIREIIRQRTSVYLFIGKCTPWESSDKFSGANELTNDLNPPTPPDTVQNVDFEIWRNMIAAKKINPNDVKHVIPRYDWSLNNDGSGKVYSQYDDLNKSLFNSTTSPFYVFTDDFNVYKCIFNNYGAQSTEKPTGTNSSTMIKTSDGYVWKYMYSISPSDSLKFVTTSHIPVETLKEAPNLTNDSSQQGLQWQVQKSAVDGGVHSFVKISEGEGYRGLIGSIFGEGYYDSSQDTTTFSVSQLDANFTAGMIDNYFNNMTMFFTNSSVRRKFKIVNFIAPDLTNNINASIVVEGRADLNSPIVEDRIPINTTFEIGPSISTDGDISSGILPSDGIGFSAVARIEDDLLGNNTYKISSIEILSNGHFYRTCPVEFKMDVGVSPSIKSEYRMIISPKGGHGSDPVEELGGFYVMLNTRLEYDETLAELTTDNDYRQIGLIQDPTDFSTGKPAEKLIYLQSKSIELVLDSLDPLTDDLPFVHDEMITNGNDVYGKILDTKEYDTIDNTTGLFEEDGLIDKKVLRVTNVFSKSGKSFEIGDSITTMRGGSEITTTIKKIISESLVKNSGEVLYLEQRKPITRDIDQIEDIKIIIEF